MLLRLNAAVLFMWVLMFVWAKVPGWSESYFQWIRSLKKSQRHAIVWALRVIFFVPTALAFFATSIEFMLYFAERVGGNEELALGITVGVVIASCLFTTVYIVFNPGEHTDGDFGEEYDKELDRK